MKFGAPRGPTPKMSENEVSEAWSCYIPLERQFYDEQKPQKQHMLKMNGSEVIGHYVQ